MKKKLFATILTATMILGASTTAMAAETVPTVSANVPFIEEEIELAGVEVAENMTVTDGVAINEENFPDEVFRTYVLEEGFDIDGNGVLSAEELNKVVDISVSFGNASGIVKDLTGIEYFTNLQELVCANNQLTSLDVNCFKNLTYLDCSGNNIEELRIEGLDKLYKVKCRENDMEVLELHGLTNLSEVVADTNRLITLEMSNLPNLLTLTIFDNKLESVDVSAASSLINLWVANNHLKALDVSMLPRLGLLSCLYNPIISLDVSQNHDLLVNTFFAGGTISIPGRQYDLSQYDPSFDVSRVSDVVNLSFKGSTVSISEGFESGSYSYDCGRGFTMTVTINAGAENGFFDDVPVVEGNWKYDNIKYVYDRGIMNGISGTNLFDPDGKLNRAMFATVLYRMNGSPYDYWMDSFPDVVAGAYYYKAVAWAYQNGIVSGYSDGTYGVEKSITREQIAKMLYLYGEYEGYDVSGKASLEAFTDKDEVNGWAVPYMEWAVDAGMISGKPNGDGTFRLDPKGEATRAECAKMLAMFIQKY